MRFYALTGAVDLAKSNSKYVGVDGCKGGWLSICLNDGEDHEAKVFAEFSDLLGYYTDAHQILVDVPIGLPDDDKSVDERLVLRNCDAEAQKLLARRWMCVFPVPTRQLMMDMVAIYCEPDLNYAQLKREANKLAGMTYPPPALGILKKIAEVDEVLQGTNVGTKVKEVHPEICFLKLISSHKPLRSKRNPDGISQRLAVLKSVYCGQEIQDIYDSALREFKLKRNLVSEDDILDALVAAVTSKLGHQRDYKFGKLPAVGQPPDSKEDLPMEMVYVEAAPSAP